MHRRSKCMHAPPHTDSPTRIWGEWRHEQLFISSFFWGKKGSSASAREWLFCQTMRYVICGFKREAFPLYRFLKISPLLLTHVLGRECMYVSDIWDSPQRDRHQECGTDCAVIFQNMRSLFWNFEAIEEVTNNVFEAIEAQNEIYIDSSQWWDACYTIKW